MGDSSANIKTLVHHTTAPGGLSLIDWKLHLHWDNESVDIHFPEEPPALRDDLVDEASVEQDFYDYCDNESGPWFDSWDEIEDHTTASATAKADLRRGVWLLFRDHASEW